MQKRRTLTQVLTSTIATALLVVVFNGAAIAAPESIYVPPGVPVESSTTAELTLTPTTLSIIGCAAPNAFVTLIEDERPVGTVIADASGRFTKILGAQSPGLHNIKAYYEDQSGLISATTTKNVSLGAHGNTALPVFLPPTATATPANVQAGQVLTFRGETIPFATVNVIVDNNDALITTANSFGEWSIEVSTLDYFVGLHTYKVLSGTTTSPCDESEQSNKYQFRVTSPSPKDDHTDTDAIPKLDAPVITTPKDQYVSSTPGVLIEGAAAPNTQIELFVDGVLAGSVFSNARGTWQFPFEMTKRQHTLLVKACFTGVCSDLSNEITLFYYGDFGGCAIDFRLDEYRFWGLAARDGINIEMLLRSGQGRHEMLIDWGDATIEHLNLYRDNENKFHHVYKERGQYNGIITLEDSNGCIQTEYFSVIVGATMDEFNWWWLLIAFIPPATALLVRNAVQREESRVVVRHISRPSTS